MAATQLPIDDQPIDDQIALKLASSSPQALWAKLRPDWLTGYGDRNALINQQWIANVDHRCYQLRQHSSSYFQSHYSQLQKPPIRDRPLLLIAESDPLDFLASFWAALLSGWDIALADPKWGDCEWNSALQILHPALTWPVVMPCGLGVGGLGVGDRELSSQALGQTQPTAISRAEPSILIPTGGTSGLLKFACHTWATLSAAAISFCQTFPTPIHTYCVLPVHHVSGLMQIFRAWLSQAQVIITPFKALETGSPLIHNPAGWYISLVPTQLVRLIAVDKSHWLSHFQAVLLGGAPPWATLLAQASKRNIPFYLSYGMTETAAMVTVQAASDRLSHSSGRSLPHAKIAIEADGQLQGPNTVGRIVIHSAAIAHGYYGADSAAFSSQKFYTDDLGYLTAQGQLHITGRASSKIISGGENIFPAEVEAALRSTGQVKDVYVFGQPDSQWGEAVVAAFVPAHSQVTSSRLQAALSSGIASPLLSRYKHPKKWISLNSIPRNAQGKLLKSALMVQIAQLSNP
ncbi:MAG: AMP-binding protein [Phormidesmis sp.]